MKGDAALPFYRGTTDVLGPNLTVLFVGFNPGLRSGETGHHYAGRNNRFWLLLKESGLFDRKLDPAEDRLVLGQGYGLTNLVARTTPGSGDLRSAEMREGAAVLRRKIEICGPRVVCYLGKGVYTGASGKPPGTKVAYGLQPAEVVAGSKDFVAHSPSGRATAGYQEKLAVFRDLAAIVGEVEEQMGQAWRLRFAHNIVVHALAARQGETVTLACDLDAPGDLPDVLRPEVQRSGATFRVRDLGGGAAGGLGEKDCLVLAPSVASWRNPTVRELVGMGGEAAHVPEGPKGRFRTIFLPPMPADVCYRAFSMPYRDHVAFHDRLMVTLKRATKLEVTAPGGTSLSFRARPFVAQSFGARREGSFMLGIPGEVTTAPLEGSAEGTIVYDPCVYLGMTSEALTLEVRRGRVESIFRSGRPDWSRALPDPVADLFIDKLQDRSSAWPDALHVGEFGLGTSATARFSGCIMEDEMVMGSCHFDLGANVQFGGVLKGPFHGGGLVSRPTLKVDGVTILKDGLYVERNLA